MKNIILIILLAILTISLFADFNQPIRINTSSDNLIFQGNNGYTIIGDTLYIVYNKNTNQTGLLFFAKLNLLTQEISQILVDSTYNNYNSYYTETKSAPSVSVDDNGKIIIVYNKHLEDNSFELWKATSVNNGQTFEKNIIDESVIQDGNIKTQNSETDLLYVTGLMEYLSNYQYTTEIEASENVDNVYFWGHDEFFGKVFSNDDIWMNDVGGWPVFHDFVGTAGIFRYSPDGDHLENHVSYDDIFQGGWAEHLPSIQPDGIESIIANGLRPFDGFTDYDIARVHITGTSFTSMLGRIVLTEIKDFPVYSWYPKNAAEANAAVAAGHNWFEEENILYTNHVPIYDTLWVNGPSMNVSGHSVFVDGLKLWIDGTVTGKQTWACSDTIYIVDDITYSGTATGEAPDDDNNLNNNDYFGLVSEQRIYIKYKFKDPLNDFALNDNNCHNIYLYGAFAAMGKADSTQYGDYASHHDGVFTFEYQHPHGSTPNFTALSPYTGEDTLYTYIDLHKFIFPPNAYVAPDLLPYNIHGGNPVAPYNMCGYPYEDSAYQPQAYAIPYGTDYPWYNPVWPESAATIVAERGTIHMFGAIHQTRRGFIHRSGCDPDNHPGNNQWNIENENYNFAGTHPSTGYSKDYHYDSRFIDNPPIDFVTATSISDEQTLYLKKLTDAGLEDIYSGTVTNPILHKFFVENSDSKFIFIQSEKSYLEGFKIAQDGTLENHFNIDLYTVSATLDIKSLKMINDDIYVLASNENNNFILKFNEASSNITQLAQFDNVGLSSFTISPTGLKIYANILDDRLDVYYANESNNFSNFNTFNYDFSSWIGTSSILAVRADADDNIFVTCKSSLGDLYLISGHLDVLDSDDNNITPPKTFEIKAYPNPFVFDYKTGKADVKISFDLDKKADINITIYNLKGQLVKTLLSQKLSAGKHQITWNGKDKNNIATVNGIYLCKITKDKKSYIKKLTLLK